MNSVILIGRLTRDPELRYTNGSQMAIAKFSLAIDRPTRQGEEKKADFPRVTVFGKQAENCEKYLSKGKMVCVQGRIQTGSYQDKDGKTVYTTDVIASNVEFLSSRNEGGYAQSQQGGYGQAQGGYNQPQGGYSQPQAPAGGFQQEDSYADGPQGIPEGFQALQDDDIPF